MPPKKKTVNVNSDIESDENDENQNQNDSDQNSQENDDSDVDSDEIQSSQGDDNDDNKDNQRSGSDEDNAVDGSENEENNTDDEDGNGSGTEDENARILPEASAKQPSEIDNDDDDSNGSVSGSEDESDNISDSDDPYKENYLQKLRQDATIDHLKSVHHELQQHNYQEVSVRTQIERNDEGIIIDPYHRTPPFLSKYEKARILGIRTTQLNHGHMPMVQTRNADNSLISLEEYRQKKIPFIIRRPLPNGTSEYWKFADLEQL